jgi:hypothetical protein
LFRRGTYIVEGGGHSVVCDIAADRISRCCREQQAPHNNNACHDAMRLDADCSPSRVTEAALIQTLYRRPVERTRVDPQAAATTPTPKPRPIPTWPNLCSCVLGQIHWSGSTKAVRILQAPLIGPTVYSQHCMGLKRTLTPRRTRTLVDIISAREAPPRNTRPSQRACRIRVFA